MGVIESTYLYRWSFTFLVAILIVQCEVLETCASCADPDYTAFLFDTTASGFNPNEIDSFYIVRFPRGNLSSPIDTTEILVNQNPFLISSSLFGSSTLNEDYVVEGGNQEFRFEITDIDFTIVNNDDDCGCDAVQNKSLRINGNLISVTDPFQAVLLQK